MSTSSPAQDARPPDVFVDGMPRDSAPGNQPDGRSNGSEGHPLPPPQEPHELEQDPENDDHVSDTDTEMADALPYFEEDPDSTAASDQDILTRLPGFFRLLDLIDERGSGGIVEKIVIDQLSLHQLLNTLQPGSYDSVSKINFKSLDSLSVKPTGVYGIQSEILSFLQRAQCLDDDCAMLLLHSRTPDGSALRSGLYLVLQPDDDPNGPSNKAYIVYWPEDSTWDDQAASSSVRRNRVTFMRYLTKITDQLIVLVSSAQANAFVWNTSAQNKDRLTDQAVDDEEDEEDDLRMRSFEVSKSLEQDEAAIASDGFKVRIESKHLPKDEDNAGVCLVPGEQKPALLVWRHEPQQTGQNPFDERISTIKLRNAIFSKKDPIQLGNLSLDSLLALGSNGLREKHPKPFEKYDRMTREARINLSNAEGEDKKFINKRIEEDKKKVKQEVREITRVLHDSIYPSLQLTSDIANSPEDSAILYQRYSGLRNLAEDARRIYRPDVITDKKFQDLKHKWFLLRDYLTANPPPAEADQNDFVNDVLNGGSPALSPKSKGKQRQSVSSFWPSFATPSFVPNALVNWVIGSSPDTSSRLGDALRDVKDPDFVQLLRPLENLFPVLAEITKQIYERLIDNLSKLEERIIQEQSRRRNQQAFETLLQDLRAVMNTAVLDTVLVNSLRRVDTDYSSARSSNSSQFHWSGTRTVRYQAQARYRICPLEMTEEDSQACRTDEAYVPQPKLEWRHKFEFTLETHRKVEFLCLVHGKCLVVVSEPEQSRIYIEDNVSIDRAINTSPGKVTLHHKSLGGSCCIFAFDQTTRLFAIVHGQEETLRLSVYVFDELFVTLRSRGSPISLKGWYDSKVCISKACFISGSEQICLIETSGQARIFSLVMRQFRNPPLKVNDSIVDAFSAPDGSCLLIVAADRESPSNAHKLLAFHWASFGSNQNGIHSASLVQSGTGFVATRLEGRGRVYVLTMASNNRTITSTALQIKQKATEYSFRSNRRESRASRVETTNNSLIDCHLEVWTRFPVIPAVSRTTLSPIIRHSRKITFATSVSQHALQDYFTRMIAIFEKTTRKPMDGTLSAIDVESATSIGDLISDRTSEFRLGSFIVELLCLIPLHLAITRDNRFIPLRDGVWEPEYERSLLGADVPAIIDALSLGWYESLFQSYMATKPVRVVSSMGEQSVGESKTTNLVSFKLTEFGSLGKSYCLNHFADTSFAGSAMRTTEGVWLSCTPTDSYLLVSLDFEGVHSIERSAQEDALLVLFNTAISNLVLFRNNFAMSRDIAGLFTSFQSSAMVLDPSANRGLFNSILAIIIKDVTRSDANDIVNEFSLKFREIVEKEKEQNFITRLHRGRIEIIPWPVINSPGFYTLFRRLQEKLGQQEFTHGTAGAFLHNLKTLMAKIKTSDWGALDQNLAAHRAQQLNERLPSALCYGRADEGLLKNMDTDEELPLHDRQIAFFVPDLGEGNGPDNEASVEQRLREIIGHHEPTPSTRHRMADAAYVENLQQRIHDSLDQRMALVRRWISVNIDRFQAENQDIRNVLGKLDGAALAMRAAVRICSLTCLKCQLLCLRPHRHTDDHECGTNHRCAFNCSVLEKHTENEPCGLPAGHSGRHMCNVKAHSCGEVCHLSSMGGCAQSCVQPLCHEGKHLCSARSHLCGKPCDLRNVNHGSGKFYSCTGTCNAPWNESHERHACDNARACPIECTLCRRLCCDTDHFHGLNPDSIHLCGQEHSCSKLCEVEGICQIETRPSAIEEQFFGRHASFQYTKYTQVDRRLSCVVPIPPDQLSHAGVHTHSTDHDVFHHCDFRCPNCEYLCTLPLKHNQLHDTSHGSMTATQWAMEGEDENQAYEIQGRKFGSGDHGAPMMCNMVCAAQGRHAHIDYCEEVDPDDCNNPESEHITERMNPNPEQAKDWISHGTYWARSGFKDPYSQEEQVEFSKCDVLCPGPEHEVTATRAAESSYCTLPIFHPPQDRLLAPANGYVSLDGHSFACQNPARLHQSYHIVFVIDSSGSMEDTDRHPMPNTPISRRLEADCDNRYGAVLSALYSFWLSRDTAASSTTQIRQDAYSVVTFDHYAETRVANDFTSTTDELIDQLIPQTGCGGTDFGAALAEAHSLIENHWNTDKAPVVIFLSDGECNIANDPIYDLCHTCARLGYVVCSETTLESLPAFILRFLQQTSGLSFGIVWFG
ncbi:hypothetical protein BDV93DRAFT_303052 [Ceratobasidium sp. AG-I]|nr:hypothetical protein BDV93DRAFT_303052 [Ceratobasidium sp. AG-I]